MCRRPERRGFTLVELLAALALSGLVMIGGLLLLDQLSDNTSRIVRRGTMLASDANGLRVLRQLLLDARMTADSFDRFRGDERSVELTTLCHRPGGWLESCRASLGADWRPDSTVLIARFSTGENLELARSPGHAALRYLDLLRPDSLWMRRWALSITMPAALGIVAGRDTLVYPLGAARD